MSYSPYLTRCACGATTSKSYARAHDGKCKACATGVEKTPDKSMLCPDCGEHYLTPYQKRHGYHCVACTREADPIGHYNEVMGYNDHGDY